MSSGFRKQLLQSQAYSGTTKKGDVVVLPPDSEDVILVTKCSGKDSGVVKATLEHSPDKNDANFSSVQAEKISHTAGGSGWGNLKYLDTTATGVGSDYKNKTVKANNLSGQSHDIFHDTMTKDDPWTISTWIKSSEQPDVEIVTQGNTKYFTKGGNQNDYFETTNLTASGSNQILRNTKAWTISFWYKTSSVNQGIFWGTDAGGSGVMHLGILTGNRLFMQGAGNMGGYCYYDFIPSTDTWYHIVVTNEPVASNGDTWYWDRDDSSSQKGLKVYVDGSAIARYSGNSTSTGTMFTDSNPFRMFARGDWQSATGDYDEISVHNETKSSSQITSMYASGVPTDLTNDSSAVVWLRADPMSTTGSQLANSTTITNSSGASSASNYVTSCNTTSTGNISISNLGSSESIYKNHVYADTYLPVLFSTGSSINVPSVAGNLKCFTKGGTTADYFTTTNLTANTSNQVLQNTKAWTISLWYKTPSTLDTGALWGHTNYFGNMHCAIINAYGGYRIMVQGQGGASGFAYYTQTFSTDTWYHIVVTNEPVDSDGNDWYFDRDDSAGEKGIKVYINGSADSQLAGETGALTGHQWDTGSDFRLFDRGSWNDLHGDYDEISIHNVTKSSSQISDMYASGVPTDLSSDSSAVVWLRADGMETEGLANGDTITNSGSASTTYVTTCTTTSTGNISVSDLGSSETIYEAAIVGGDSFGNGMRMSFTKKLKTDATWDATGAQTSRFLLSFDGFEDTADYFLGYNTTFTRPLHPKTGAEDASADLLDGEWHNIIVSYRGGAPGTAVNPHDYIAVCFDGKQMAASGVCSIDPSTHTTQAACEGAGGTWIGGCVEKTSTVTFVNDHFRYTDVTEDLRGTFFLSAGDPFTAAGTNSKYAFQGGFDETSLHNDSWQLGSSPTTGWASGGFNTMKPNTIYGIDNTRNGANDAGSPYDLKNPSSIGHPGPTGNSYIEPSASAVGGGLQAYYRWGDTPGDCSTSIHDVQSAIDNVTDRDLAVLYGSITAGDATDENSAAWNTAVDTVAEGGIEVASTSIAGSAGFALENVQITCADGLQFFRVNAPKLANLRIKWTGAGTATSVEASIHYRRRKK